MNAVRKDMPAFADWAEEKKLGGCCGLPETEEPGSLDDFLTEMFEETPRKYPHLPSPKDLAAQFKTTSAKIRYLYQLKATPKEIQELLNIRPQHVRNVLSTNLKRGPNESFTPTDQQAQTQQTVPLLPKYVDQLNQSTSTTEDPQHEPTSRCPTCPTR